MTALLTATCLLWLLHCFSLGFKVIQPGSVTVHSDRTVSISCQHTESNASSIVDVRLNRYEDGSTPESRATACQVGELCPLSICPNISWLKESADKYTFTLHNLQQRDMEQLYECEFTKFNGDVFETKWGSPATKVQTEPRGANDLVAPTCPPSSSPPPPPVCSHHNLLSCLLIGLLTVLLLYCSLITALYLKLRRRNEPETNSTYMDMRKALGEDRTPQAPQRQMAQPPHTNNR